jgi:hypothetical protein
MLVLGPVAAALETRLELNSPLARVAAGIFLIDRV